MLDLSKIAPIKSIDLKVNYEIDKGICINNKQEITHL